MTAGRRDGATAVEREPPYEPWPSGGPGCLKRTARAVGVAVAVVWLVAMLLVLVGLIG